MLLVTSYTVFTQKHKSCVQPSRTICDISESDTKFIFLHAGVHVFGPIHRPNVHTGFEP